MNLLSIDPPPLPPNDSNEILVKTIGFLGKDNFHMFTSCAKHEYCEKFIVYRIQGPKHWQKEPRTHDQTNEVARRHKNSSEDK